jgi:hypothetical protein
MNLIFIYYLDEMHVLKTINWKILRMVTQIKIDWEKADGLYPTLIYVTRCVCYSLRGADRKQPAVKQMLLLLRRSNCAYRLCH